MTDRVSVQVIGGNIKWPLSTNGEQVFQLTPGSIPVELATLQAVAKLESLEHKPGVLSRAEGQGEHPLIVCQTCGKHLDILHTLEMEFHPGFFASCTGPLFPPDRYPKSSH